MSPTSWIYFILMDPWWKWPNLGMVLMSNVSIFVVFVVEKLMGVLNNGVKLAQKQFKNSKFKILVESHLKDFVNRPSCFLRNSKTIEIQFFIFLVLKNSLELFFSSVEVA